MKKILKTSILLFTMVIGTNKIEAQPINNAFNNDALYECIIERYNKENDTTYDVNHNLTDEELNNISYLTCSDYAEITDYTGIEKLTSLTKIWVSVDVETLDLSHNTNLEDITLFDYGISAVESVSVLKNLTIGNNTNLKHLRVDSNLLTNIDISNNPNILTLAIWSKKLESIDLSHNNKITSLSLGSNKIPSLNISNLNDLTSLDLLSYPLNTIDLSHNTKLKNLEIRNSKLTNISLNNNENLEYIDLNGNSLTEIDLSHNTKVKKLYLQNNMLTKLDLSNNNLLEKVQIFGNKFMNNIVIDSLDNTISLDDYIKLPHGYSFNYQITDEEVAKVENGKIIPLKVGTTTGTLTISNTYNQVLADSREAGTVINGVKYKYVIEDIDFPSNITVNNNQPQKIEETQEDKKSIENPKTGVYGGSILVIIIAIIVFLIAKSRNKYKKI